jgi:hypothetical protein
MNSGFTFIYLTPLDSLREKIVAELDSDERFKVYYLHFPKNPDCTTGRSSN